MSEQILTLQFGAYSNFVGAHFWNAQVRKMMSDIFELLQHVLMQDEYFGALDSPEDESAEYDWRVLYQTGSNDKVHGGVAASLLSCQHSL